MYKLRIIFAVMFVLACAVCAGSQQKEGSVADMRLMIDDISVSVEWENNDSVKALSKMLPLSVKMSMYGGFEQVGSLGRSLPRNDKRITTKAGDIVLYSGNQIVIFYGSNTWAYTKLGRITGKTQAELAELLGKSDVVVKISVD